MHVVNKGLDYSKLISMGLGGVPFTFLESIKLIKNWERMNIRNKKNVSMYIYIDVYTYTWGLVTKYVI